jgi:hypothetical protein
MMFKKFVLTLALVLGACTVERDPELFPANDAARATGPLYAHLIGHGGGNGTIALTLPSGEVLEGRYSINVGGGMGFGSLYATAYGTGGIATASGYTTGFSIPNGSPGTADMIGPRGTTAHCEFMNNNMVGHGNGACQLSTGALYRMQY